ncbi:MAG: FG-GAP repeat domain-containing protein [Isosphaeraceae bacterium]
MTRSVTFTMLFMVLPLAPHFLPRPAYGQQFDRRVIDANLPGGYQVEVADINGDQKPDIVALGGSTCAWYENPTWKKRIVTSGKQTPGIISTATADLDGDGKAEIAIAYDFEMTQPGRGKVLLAVQGKNIDDAWKLTPVLDVGSVHRLRWGDLNGDQKLDLVAAPIFGPQARPPAYLGDATVLALEPRESPRAWLKHFVIKHPVIHAIEVGPIPTTSGHAVVLIADNKGISIVGEDMATDGTSWTLSTRILVPGASGKHPNRGCSEIHLGRLRDGLRFLATIEPWHGTDVVVWREQKAGSLDFGGRTALDTTLNEGHALWVADVDGDGDDEVFAGHRGIDHRVSVYDFDRSRDMWARRVIDRDIAAQDLRGGDLDRDGTPDIVAVGGATHNVIWYRPRRP